jgi:voltage-gated potassium channel
MKEFWQLVKERGLWRVIVILFSILLFAATIVYYFEHKHNPHFSGFVDAFWWAVVTVSTVGYGDITPTTLIGKMLTSLFILSGVITVSIFTATISSFYISKMIQEGKGLSQIKKTGHFLLLGWNSAGNKIIENLIQENPNVQITMINQLPEERINELLITFKQNLTYVRGDFTRELILKRANITEAKSVIIIPDESTPQTDGSLEEKSLLAILTVKGLTKKANIVVYSPSIESRPHLKRAGADAVITPENWIATSLVAQVLNPGINEVIQKLLFSAEDTQLHPHPISADLVGKKYSKLESEMRKQGKILLGIYREEKNIQIDDILSDDSSYLDEFIRKKFAEAGRTNIKDNNIDINLLPDAETEISELDVAIVVEKI